MTRKKIAPAELHDILTREFRKSAGDLCMKCRIPMPAYLEPGEGGGPNWRIGGIAECSSLCHTFLEDLVGKLSTQYDITRAGKKARRGE
jgi:hypothetical protein